MKNIHCRESRCSWWHRRLSVSGILQKHASLVEWKEKATFYSNDAMCSIVIFGITLVESSLGLRETYLLFYLFWSVHWKLKMCTDHSTAWMISFRVYLLVVIKFIISWDKVVTVGNSYLLSSEKLKNIVGIKFYLEKTRIVSSMSVKGNFSVTFNEIALQN